MKFRVIARSLVALAAIVLTMMIALPAQAATATATFTKGSDWGSGFEGKYTITNGGTTTINGWSVAFDLPSGANIGSFWDASMSRSGQRFTFTNVGWNGTLAPGATRELRLQRQPGRDHPVQLHAQRRRLRRRHHDPGSRQARHAHRDRRRERRHAVVGRLQRHGDRLPGLRGHDPEGHRHRHERHDLRPGRLRVAHLHGRRLQRHRRGHEERPGERHHHRLHRRGARQARHPVAPRATPAASR